MKGVMSFSTSEQRTHPSMLSCMDVKCAIEVADGWAV